MLTISSFDKLSFNVGVYGFRDSRGQGSPFALALAQAIFLTSTSNKSSSMESLTVASPLGMSRAKLHVRLK